MSAPDTARRGLPLLGRMTDDFRRRGSLRRSTAMAMWAAYGVHAASTAWALTWSDRLLPVPRRLARLCWGGVVGGTLLGTAGMSRFAGLGQLEGTRHDELATGGVYRYSRNPQYVGYVIALGGAALARRSLSAAALTAALATVYAAWIPVEEKRLVELYGQPYRDYCRATSRWWGRSRPPQQTVQRIRHRVTRPLQ